MNKQILWIEVSIPAALESFEALGNFLFEQGSCGLEEDKEILKGYFQENVFSDKTKTLLESYIVTLRGMGFSVGNPIYRKIPFENWNYNWKKFFKPIQVTSRIVVKPPWEKWKSGSDQIIINITPRMAFGTGTHETTQLLLELLEIYLCPSETVLDVGTGSGILGIAGARLGASRVLGVEIDKNAFENARENIIYNKVDRIVEIRQGSVETIGSEKFDLVLANIDRSTITNLLPEFGKYTFPTSKLLFSGFLTTDRKEIEKTFSACSYQLIEARSRGEWLSFVVCKTR